MALFKFRKSGEAVPTPASLTSAPAESLEAIRKKATYRLIGAVVLVVAAVIGFPMLLDSQPRPVPVEVRIDIPDKNKVKPLPVPAASVAPAVPVALPVQAERPEAPVSALVSPPEPKVKPAPAAEKPAAESLPVKDDGARAQALLEGKAKEAADPKEAAASGGKFVVQVGAYADPDKAREARSKLERAGLKTYTQVAKTKDGERIRVRVGPFADRSQAEHTAAKVKALSLDAAILSL